MSSLVISGDTSGSVTLEAPTVAGSPVLTLPTTTGILVATDTAGNILLKTPTLLGYGTGAGGNVVQATNKATAVTLNKPCGQITLNNAALAASTTVAFTVNNSLVSITDCIILSCPGGGSVVNYNYWTQPLSTGFIVYLKNISTGSLSDALVLNFAIIKGATV